jgi:S1-C subfamily serine protease
LLARLDDFKVGDTVTITILRDGKQQQRSVQLQAE